NNDIVDNSASLPTLRKYRISYESVRCSIGAENIVSTHAIRDSASPGGNITMLYLLQNLLAVLLCIIQGLLCLLQCMLRLPYVLLQVLVLLLHVECVLISILRIGLNLRWSVGVPPAGVVALFVYGHNSGR